MRGSFKDSKPGGTCVDAMSRKQALSHLSAHPGLGGTAATGVRRVQGTASACEGFGATSGVAQGVMGRCSAGRAGFSLGVV